MTFAELTVTNLLEEVIVQIDIDTLEVIDIYGWTDSLPTFFVPDSDRRVLAKWRKGKNSAFRHVHPERRVRILHLLASDDWIFSTDEDGLLEIGDRRVDLETLLEANPL